MGSNPCRRLSLLGFAHPVVGPPSRYRTGTREDGAPCHEYEEGRVVALRRIFVKYIIII